MRGYYLSPLSRLQDQAGWATHSAFSLTCADGSPAGVLSLKMQPAPSSCFSKNLWGHSCLLSFSHFPRPLQQQTLSAHPSKCVQNPTLSPSVSLVQPPSPLTPATAAASPLVSLLPPGSPPSTPLPRELFPTRWFSSKLKLDHVPLLLRSLPWLLALGRVKTQVLAVAHGSCTSFLCLFHSSDCPAHHLEPRGLCLFLQNTKLIGTTEQQYLL